MSSFHVAVIGAGIAGLTAAYKAAAQGLAVVHFVDPDAPAGGLVANVGELHGIPWTPSASGIELANRLSDAAAFLGVQVVSIRAESLQTLGTKFRISAGGSHWAADQVILATGASLKDIDIPGAREFKSDGVLNCAWCNAGLFRGRPVVVVGGGDSALQESLHLARHASSVTVVTSAAAFSANQQYLREAARLANVHFRWDTEALEIIGPDSVRGLRVRHAGTKLEECLDGDAVFVYIGLAANAGLAEGLARVDAQGYLPTNQQLETSCPGLFAIGAVRSGYNGDIVTAMGDAATAALAATARTAQARR